MRFLGNPSTIVWIALSLCLAPRAQGEIPSHIWSEEYGVSGREITRGVAVDASGNTIIAGGFTSDIDLGGGPLRCAGLGDVFLAMFDAAGAHLWSRRFGDIDQENVRRMCLDSAGNIYLTGLFTGTLDFGGGPLVCAGQEDFYLVKLDSSGAHLWSRLFGDTGSELGTCVTVDGEGDIVVAGMHREPIDLGGGMLPFVNGADIFLAEFKSSTGAHLWSTSYGGQKEARPNRVAVDRDGDISMTGYFEETLDFGGDLLRCAGDVDVFLAKLGEDISGIDSRDVLTVRLLQPVYPNPFHRETTIALDLPMRAKTSVAVYRVSGRLVRTIVDGEVGPGNHLIL